MSVLDLRWKYNNSMDWIFLRTTQWWLRKQDYLYKGIQHYSSFNYPSGRYFPWNYVTSNHCECYITWFTSIQIYLSKPKSSWVWHKNDFEHPAPPTHTLGSSLQEHQMTIYWSQMYMIWSALTIIMTTTTKRKTSRTTTSTMKTTTKPTPQQKHHTHYQTNT